MGAFLLARRARLSPAEVGLPHGERRRTPGLRREEVALLAGIGVTWYTWLEQGRPIRVSAPALQAIAAALRLDAEEAGHLFALAGRPTPPAPPSLVVPVGVRRLLDGLGPTPAYITNDRWDILAWNRAVSVVFTDYGTLPEEDRNVVYGLFARLGHNRFLRDWERSARVAVGQLRRSYGHHREDPGFAALIERCQRVSPEFRTWWPRQEVRNLHSRRLEYDFPAVGCLAFDYAKARPAEAPDLWLVINTPAPGTATAETIARLGGAILVAP